MTPKPLSQMLRAEIAQQERENSFDGNFDVATAISWAGKSLAVALDRATQYCVMDGSTCKYG